MKQIPEIVAGSLPSIPVGTRVKVIGSIDGMMDTKHIGMEGNIIELDHNHRCGEIHEENVGCIDPMYKIGFDDGSYDGFWREEIDIVL